MLDEAHAVALTMLPFVMALVQLIKPTKLKPDFYPHASLACGLLLGLLVGVFTQDYSNIIAGGIAGLAASGLYDLGKGV